MNKLLIPPSPNWYETDILACAPDNTLIYGARQDIVVIKPTAENEPHDVHIISKSHSTRIKSVSINRNWGQPHKYAATVSEDKIVKLWDIETLEKKSSHNKHILLDDNSKIVGASFAGDDRVVSISETGIIVIWNITTNETNAISSLFETKVTVTCMSVCPHATWLAGFGLKNGLIIVVDLRRTGKILHKLRGHDKAIVSLAWCPVPVNIFPSKPNNKVVEKRKEEEKESLNKDNEEKRSSIKESTDSDETDKTDRRKQKNPKKAPNPWVELIHPDDEPNIFVKKTDQENDYLKECADLKEQILLISISSKDKSVADEASATEESKTRIKLKPKTKSRKCHLSNLLLKKEQELQEIQEDSGEKSETVESPTDRRELSMEISDSVENMDGSVTNTSEKSMEITTCERKESTETTLSEPDRKDECVYVSAASDDKESSLDSPKLDSTTSSDENKKFSSASSCDDLNCSKRNSDIFEPVKKSDTSSASESGDVFHDAEVCETKEDKDSRVTDESTNFEEQPRREFLLASSAREPNIYIWRAGTDGRMQTFLTVPNVKNQKKTRVDKLWITICWVAPNILLSSSRTAELLEWTLPRPMVQSKFIRQIHKDHWSVLFSIKAPILYLSEYDFLQKRDINAWTTGMDRLILNTDIGSRKNLGCFPALGGSVNCLKGSPLDPNRLAFGTGEGIVNVWDLSREHKKRIVFSTYYQKIMSSVTALAWHPVIETSLAWATNEGRIGLLDTGGKGKSPKILPHYFKTEIYKMEWGPLNGDVENLGLFVVGEAKIAIFDPKSQEKEPQLLEVPDNTSIYTMSWKPRTYSFLLVTSKTGSLITYTPDLKISKVSYVRHKLQSIVWNPDADSDDMTVSKYCQTFVSLVKSTDFIVYNLGIESDNMDDKVVVYFENRKTVINVIEWNPHSSNQLVFVDVDGVAQVYDIETKTILSSYINPYLDALLSVCWSPVDQDYIIVGTVAHKIIIWKVSENAPLTDKEINSHRNKLTKAQHKAVNDHLMKEKLEVSFAVEPEESKLKKSTKSPILPVFYGVREKTQVQDIRKLLQWKLGDKTVEPNIGDSKYIDVLDVFADRENAEKILDLNISTFRRQGKHQNGNLLTLFKGDIATAIKEAIDQKRVTPWIISVCPMVSPRLWQTACETYANQLLEESEADPMEIVTYLLTCHKVEEAVNVLCERAMFREALVLAKVRFGPDNTIVSEILDKWAKDMIYRGNFEVAAQCYVALGKFENAASVLFRRSKVELLKLAVELAELSGNEELHKAVLFRFNAFKTEGGTEQVGEQSDKGNKEDSSIIILPDKNFDNNSGDRGDNKICEKSNADNIDIVQPSTNGEQLENGNLDDCMANINNEVKEYLESQEKLLCKLKEASHMNENGYEENQAKKEETVDQKEVEKCSEGNSNRDQDQDRKVLESQTGDLHEVPQEESDYNIKDKNGEDLSEAKSSPELKDAKEATYSLKESEFVSESVTEREELDCRTSKEESLPSKPEKIQEKSDYKAPRVEELASEIEEKLEESDHKASTYEALANESQEKLEESGHKAEEIEALASESEEKLEKLDHGTPKEEVLMSTPEEKLEELHREAPSKPEEKLEESEHTSPKVETLANGSGEKLEELDDRASKEKVLTSRPEEKLSESNHTTLKVEANGSGEKLEELDHRAPKEKVLTNKPEEKLEESDHSALKVETLASESDEKLQESNYTATKEELTSKSEEKLQETDHKAQKEKSYINIKDKNGEDLSEAKYLTDLKDRKKGTDLLKEETLTSKPEEKLEEAALVSESKEKLEGTECKRQKEELDYYIKDKNGEHLSEAKYLTDLKDREKGTDSLKKETLTSKPEEKLEEESLVSESEEKVEETDCKRQKEELDYNIKDKNGKNLSEAKSSTKFTDKKEGKDPFKERALASGSKEKLKELNEEAERLCKQDSKREYVVELSKKMKVSYPKSREIKELEILIQELLETHEEMLTPDEVRELLKKRLVEKGLVDEK